MPTKIDSYETLPPYNMLSLYNGTGQWYAVFGQSFTNTDKMILDSCSFYLRKTGTPSGNVYCCLFAHSGTYGTSSIGVSDAITNYGIANMSGQLATSDAVIKTDISTTAGWVTFTFSGDQRVKLNANTYYFIGIVPDADTSSGNYISVGYDFTPTTHSGNRADLYEYSPGNPEGVYDWLSSSAQDANFIVYGEPIVESFTNTQLLMGVG